MKSEIKTPYMDIHVSLYLIFSRPESLEVALAESNLPEDEKENIRKRLTMCMLGGDEYYVLATMRYPGTSLPTAYRQNARAVYEGYPSEKHFNIRKDSLGVDLSNSLNNIRWGLPVFVGRLHAPREEKHVE